MVLAGCSNVQRSHYVKRSREFFRSHVITLFLNYYLEINIYSPILV